MMKRALATSALLVLLLPGPLGCDDKTDSAGGAGGTGGSPCLATDDGNPCTDDVCVDGTVSHPAKADGAACDDANACTQMDICQGGVCVGANPIGCTAPGLCQTSTCDPTTGACSSPVPQPDGTACDDGDACTKGDACNGGTCAGTSAVTCDWGTVCVAGACVAPSVCTGLTALPGPPTLRVGSAPMGVAVTDFDADGSLDLAIANSGSAFVSVFYGLGSGEFAPSVTVPVGGANAITAADLNGDGHPDLAIAAYPDLVDVLVNQGNGTFLPKIAYSTGMHPSAITAADLNGDGKLDLVTANDMSGDASVLLNQGDATFAPHVDYAAGSQPTSVSAADLNGDGKTDLAVASPPDQTVGILFNQGDGTFSPKVDVAPDGGPTSAIFADVNGDGKLDLVAAIYDANMDNRVSVLFGDGTGAFLAPVTYPAGSAYASAVMAADLNGDGALDLVTANYYGDDASVLLNQGNGTFAPKVDYQVGTKPTALAAADLSGDGHTDVVVVNFTSSSPDTTGHVSVLRGNGDGTFPVPTEYDTFLDAKAVLAADLNGDGAPDLAVIGYDHNDPSLKGLVRVFTNQGNGTFLLLDSPQVGEWPNAIVAADLNGDGKLDLATTNDPGHDVSVLFGKGNGLFSSAADYPLGWAHTLATADLNGDGKLDLVAPDTFTQMVKVLYNQGDGTFAPAVSVAPGVDPGGVLAADLNGDGKVDLAVSAWATYETSVLLGQGNGMFGAPVVYAGGTAPLAAADLNGDGALDLVRNDQSQVSVSFNNGDGTFAADIKYDVRGAPTSIFAADLDGDGKLDLVATSEFEDKVSVLYNHGDGTFAPSVDYPAGRTASSVFGADLNGDGRVDLAVAGLDVQRVSVLLNECLP